MLNYLLCINIDNKHIYYFTDGPSTVALAYAGKAIYFSGTGYKDSTWGPNALNDFIKTWYLAFAEVGPWAFVTFSGAPSEGSNNINVGHLSYNGEFLMSQCNIIGDRSTNISVITPSGNVADSGVFAPTAFDITFVISDSQNVSFHAANVEENPSISIYHRWVANFTGGENGKQQYNSYGLAEWMNPGNLSQWPLIQ